MSFISKQQVDEILQFWFPNNKYNKFWFDKNADIDNYIFTKYGDILDNIYNTIGNENLNDFEFEELLAIIIILDQFSRNISRVNKDIHELIDDMTNITINISYIIIDKYDFNNLLLSHVVFILMPLRHSNNIGHYKVILKILEELKDKDNELYKRFKKHTLNKLSHIII